MLDFKQGLIICNHMKSYKICKLNETNLLIKKIQHFENL